MENKKFKRIFVIVTDSMGIGAAYDAKKYDDLGANTFGHIANLSESFNVPTLTKLGIGNICPNNKTPFMAKPMGIVARMIEQSVGKDTLTGHFEMMGLKNHSDNRLKYLDPLLSYGWVEMEFPDKRTSPKQTYKISKTGRQVLLLLGRK